MKVLVTGGAGYIGSHTLVELLAVGHEVVVVDNLSNSGLESLRRVEEITGKSVECVVADVSDKSALEKIFDDNQFDAVIHFAGHKAVGESVAKPLEYYLNNIGSTLVLCEVMKEHGVFRLIFSSSATVYGDPADLPLLETSRVGVGITNPYGRTKYMIEEILGDLAISDDRWQITLLRYFNPIGAHESGLIGEDPKGTPNNLLPYVTQVAVGRLDKLQVHGNDYDTVDGTGVRDYIHVVDLAQGHLAALRHPAIGGKTSVYNLSTGVGTSVLQLISAFEKTSGVKVSYEIGPRRPGDVASCYASSKLAKDDLGWEATRSVEDGCRDSWRWQSRSLT